jgi:hypothetical protein
MILFLAVPLSALVAGAVIRAIGGSTKLAVWTGLAAGAITFVVMLAVIVQRRRLPGAAAVLLRAGAARLRGGRVPGPAHAAPANRRPAATRASTLPEAEAKIGARPIE